MKKLLTMCLLVSIFLSSPILRWTWDIQTAQAAAQEIFLVPLFKDATITHYYKFSGNSNDSKGAANGTDTSISYGTSFGKFGQGASFTAAPSSISVTDTIANWQSSFSIACWVDPVFPSQQSAIVEARKTTSNYWAYLQIGSISSKNVFIFNLFDGTNNPQAIGTTIAATNTWISLLAVRDHTAAKLHLYVNGKEDVTAVTDTTTSAPDNAVVFFGRRDNNGDHLTGNLDDCAFFTRALSSAEAYKLYNGYTDATFFGGD